MNAVSVSEMAAGVLETPLRQSVVPRKVRAMPEVDDGELMLRYASGDLRAFEALYGRHRSALYRYLARHTRDPEVANDIFQEVWSRVISSRSRYEPRAKFSTFLYRIAHNCFIDHCRRASARVSGRSARGAGSAFSRSNSSWLTFARSCRAEARRQ